MMLVGLAGTKQMANQRNAPRRRILKSGTIILGKEAHIPCLVRGEVGDHSGDHFLLRNHERVREVCSLALPLRYLGEPPTWKTY